MANTSSIVGSPYVATAPEGKPSSDNPGAVAQWEFSFPGDVNSAAASREQVMQFVREHCWEVSDEIDLTIALQEALVNAALHGCQDDADKQIHCSVQIQPTRASFIISDPGPGFDYERIADPKYFESSTLEHGRGIALLRSVVDDVSFHNGGSEVRFSKHLSC